jgi:hypothetical protein
MRDSWRKKSSAPLAAVIAFLFMFGSRLMAQTEDASGQGVPKPIQAAAPVQPIPYSHKKHLAFGLKCDFCHTNPAPGINMTIPQTARCMGCHDSAPAESPAIQKLAQYNKSKQLIPWVRIYAVPAWVYWNHRRHLQAGTKCETCHGPVAEMDTMKLATNVTTMPGCVECHEQRGAPVGCENCHENTATQ